MTWESSAASDVGEQWSGGGGDLPDADEARRHRLQVALPRKLHRDDLVVIVRLWRMHAIAGGEPHTQQQTLTRAQVTTGATARSGTHDVSSLDSRALRANEALRTHRTTTFHRRYPTAIHRVCNQLYSHTGRRGEGRGVNTLPCSPVGQPSLLATAAPKATSAARNNRAAHTENTRTIQHTCTRRRPPGPSRRPHQGHAHTLSRRHVRAPHQGSKCLHRTLRLCTSSNADPHTTPQHGNSSVP